MVPWTMDDEYFRPIHEITSILKWMCQIIVVLRRLTFDSSSSLWYKPILTKHIFVLLFTM